MCWLWTSRALVVLWAVTFNDLNVFRWLWITVFLPAFENCCAFKDVNFPIIFLLSSACLEFCCSQVIWLIDGLVDVPSIPTLFRFILGTIGDGDIMWNWQLNIAEHRWARMDAVERFRYWTQSLLLLEDLRAAERPASRPNAVSYSCLELKRKCWPWPISSPTGCINWL